MGDYTSFSPVTCSDSGICSRFPEASTFSNTAVDFHSTTPSTTVKALKVLLLNQVQSQKMFSCQIFIKFSCDNFSNRNVKVTTLWSHDHTYDII